MQFCIADNSTMSSLNVSHEKHQRLTAQWHKSSFGYLHKCSIKVYIPECFINNDLLDKFFYRELLLQILHYTFSCTAMQT